MEVLAVTLATFYGDTLDHLAGATCFCMVTRYLIRFNIFYSSIGSLGVSVYRILLIKHDYWLKDVVGERIIINFILYGGLLLTTACTLIAAFNEYDKLINDTCMIAPMFFESQLGPDSPRILRSWSRILHNNNTRL